MCSSPPGGACRCSATPPSFLTDRADALTDLADVLLVAGQANEAADALALALSLYEQKGDIVTPPRIRALLDSIRPTAGSP